MVRALNDQQRGSKWDRSRLDHLGVVALAGVAVLRLAAMAEAAVSDILFMLPMSMVGLCSRRLIERTPSRCPAG
ncbi:hypothetical protein NOVOSPHI9U_560003 [Novosphingobium sp. 9U]|nr:hypothetical protein NOVOSPHI9U_560003 [Novosphingobium sp. 9U]